MEKRMLIRNRKYGLAFIFIHIYVHDRNIIIVIWGIIDWMPIHFMNGHSWSKYDIDSQTFVMNKRNDFKKF